MQWFGDVFTGEDGSFVKTRDHWTKVRQSEEISDLEHALGEWEEMTDYAAQAENGTLQPVPGYSESDPQAIRPAAVVIRLSTPPLSRQDRAFFEEQGVLRAARRKRHAARARALASLPAKERERRRRESAYKRGIIRNGDRIRPVPDGAGVWIPFSKSGWKYRRADGTFGKPPKGATRPPPFKVKRKRSKK